MAKYKKCKKAKSCYTTEPFNWKCKLCRYQKCEAMGMSRDAPLTKAMRKASQNRKMDKIATMLKDLIVKDSKREKKLKTFYSLDDENLESILKNSRRFRKIKKVKCSLKILFIAQRNIHFSGTRAGYHIRRMGISDYFFTYHFLIKFGFRAEYDHKG